MTRQRGFTLLELMTTLSVAALLVSVGVPSLQNLSLNTKRSSSVNELVSGIHLARNTAVKRNARVTVCASDNNVTCGASAEWNDGWLVFIDSDSNRMVDQGETILRTAAGFEEVSVQSDNFPNFFAYRPNGRAMSSDVATNTGEFTVCDRRGADYARVIIVDMSGRPRLSETTFSGKTPTCPST